MKENTVSAALAELAGLEAQVRVTGAVDVEPTRFEEIRRDLLSGRIDANTAIQQARKMVDSRTDYH